MYNCLPQEKNTKNAQVSPNKVLKSYSSRTFSWKKHNDYYSLGGTSVKVPNPSVSPNLETEKKPTNLIFF